MTLHVTSDQVWHEVVHPFFIVAIAIFGLGGMVWFAWLGVALLRGTTVRGKLVANAGGT